MSRPQETDEFWILHPSGKQAPAVVLLPTNGGLEAKLTQSQLDLIQSIKSTAEQIQSSLTDEDGHSFADLQSSLGILMGTNGSNLLKLKARTEEIKALLTSSTGTSIAQQSKETRDDLASILGLLQGAEILSEVQLQRANLNNSDPVINAASGDSSSEAISIPPTKKVGLQVYLSDPLGTASIAIELKRVAGAVNLSDKEIRYFDVEAGLLEVALGSYATNSITIEPNGAVELSVHLRALSGGSCSVYVWEVS